MSFFGFDASRHNPAATGFSQAHNPFAGLSNREDEGDALEFEDTYDGLGDHLEETGDAFNDDTFGDTAGLDTGPVGKDFDFFNTTAKVADAIEEEHVRFTRQQPAARAPQPATQTPAYAAPQQAAAGPAEPVAELQVDAALWGVAPKKQPQPQTVPAASPAPAPAAAPSRKVLSLEEVEAQMRAQVKKATQATPSSAPPAAAIPASSQAQVPPMHYDQAYQFQQHGQHQPPSQADHAQKDQAAAHGHGHHVTILQRPGSKQAPSPQPPTQPAAHLRQQPSASMQPTQILQNPNRLSGDAARLGMRQHPTPTMPASYPAHPAHRQQGSLSRQPQIITHPSQLAQLNEEEKAAYLEQEAKRAKRNHKIFLMSRDNGMMTPQDKSFVTRIQLQQLVAATGNPNDHGTDESLTEDFYYQVHSQIQGSQRQHPNQPLNNFAQTYLFPDWEPPGWHASSPTRAREPHAAHGTANNDRNMPPPPTNDADTEAIQKFVTWNSEAQILNSKLWDCLRIHDHPDNGRVHPFIALLSYTKGMKAMQRISRHLTHEQRTTILTLILVNLDNLEVVRNAQVTPEAMQLNAAMRENVELFSVSVMSTLFTILNELDVDLVAGMLGLVCTRNVDVISKSRIGASMLTMILSRAEIIKHGGGGNEQAWRSWDATHTQFFDLIEPSLPHTFPGPVTAGDDIYVWQLLAALGIGASPDQQQRLVLAVKDRVMDTVALSNTLPQDLAAQRLQNVNLFMRSIGLDVELLQ
ncbi:hypothetical protein CHGG_04127 [Chaetomium globosum CBS 148.51]|uniref:mRNA decay factor PAT1 domain-containing protein n=1 Tax=Chaetomium globosum (strain ATCC 6205 / CBS 148.51 / DSM 1962 / NBRC 6347 / NRRL 1970) TaxID=306901 RepID=Q2H269_CHAGB|nr:uncharacterized protein CHGG_04127 [Chaetomium globosum CBS 148.51]EAQ87508.1 hypothetical protein CHGG_04127 [Chaetomium globosum CBS 148.51]